MMEEIISADYALLTDAGALSPERLCFRGVAGDSILIQGAPGRCGNHFPVLCGLRAPEVGQLRLLGRDPYAMPPKEAAAFRRSVLGAVPRTLGWIPEVEMIHQIALPLRLAGVPEEEILERIRSLTSPLLPLHCLYNLPGKCALRRQAQAALLRAVVCSPRVVVLQGFFEELPGRDRENLWQAFSEMRPKDSVLICLSGAPSPEGAAWTKVLSV